MSDLVTRVLTVLDTNRRAFGVGLKPGSSKQCSVKFVLDEYRASLYSSFTQFSVIVWEAFEVMRDDGGLPYYSESVINYLLLLRK